MDDLLTLLGLLFLMFLVLAAAVEVMLEVFRGVLERVGVSWAKSHVSLDDALALASEFAPERGDLSTKLQAVKSVAEQFGAQASDKLEAIKRLEDELRALVPEEAVSRVAGDINAVAAQVRSEFDASERQKVFFLRAIAALLGCLLVWWADFHVLAMLVQDPTGARLLAGFDGLKSTWLNVLVGGLAAAAGSSFWHDKLDKVRKLKNVVKETRNVAS